MLIFKLVIWMLFNYLDSCLPFIIFILSIWGLCIVSYLIINWKFHQICYMYFFSIISIQSSWITERLNARKFSGEDIMPLFGRNCWKCFQISKIVLNRVTTCFLGLAPFALSSWKYIDLFHSMIFDTLLVHVTSL